VKRFCSASISQGFKKNAQPLSSRSSMKMERRHYDLSKRRETFVQRFSVTSQKINFQARRSSSWICKDKSAWRIKSNIFMKRRWKTSTGTKKYRSLSEDGSLFFCYSLTSIIFCTSAL
jgi:hypothetical protein